MLKYQGYMSDGDPSAYFESEESPRWYVDNGKTMEVTKYYGYGRSKPRTIFVNPAHIREWNLLKT